MVLAEAEQGGDCEEDYVQFGRDILFITPHRSAKVTKRSLKLHKYTFMMANWVNFGFPPFLSIFICFSQVLR